MSKFLEPKEIIIDDGNGKSSTYILSKFPAIAGREIICKYPLTGLPKVGDYNLNEETMIKLMSFVAVKKNDVTIVLETRELIDNHVPNWEMLARIECAMMEYNCSFFQQGKISNFFDNIAAKAQQLIISTLTDLSGRSSQKEKQASKS